MMLPLLLAAWHQYNSRYWLKPQKFARNLIIAIYVHIKYSLLTRLILPFGYLRFRDLENCPVEKILHSESSRYKQLVRDRWTTKP